MGIVLADSGSLREGLGGRGADVGATGLLAHMGVHLVKDRLCKFEGGHAAFLRLSRHVE